MVHGFKAKTVKQDRLKKKKPDFYLSSPPHPVLAHPWGAL